MARKKEVIMSGNPLLPGVTKAAEGYNFTVQVPMDEEASLLLYKKKGKVPAKEISLTGEYRCGEICSVLIPDFQGEKYEYNYRIGGKVVQDIYARRICGRDIFGQRSTENDEHKIRCGCLTEEAYDWKGDKPLKTPYEETILYKIHVRGYTKQAKMPAKLRGTFAGLKEMIPYWKELGITAVELMPAYDFAEVIAPEKLTDLVQEKKENKNVNYWGYLPGFYFAPKKSYCATDTPENEMRDLVKALHQAGIECIMEMYFPKDTNPMLVLEVLHFWKMFYHVDGFHLIGEGVPKEVLLQDGILKDTKLMTDWFSEEDLSKVSKGKKVLADYNLAFLQSMRSFLKSDAGVSGLAAEALRKNFEKKTTVNYMASHDGFTMNDMVSYNVKRNDANGHDNLDGSDWNFSWNCGEEGETSKKSVQALREKQLRNAFMMLLLGQGVPMIYGGDEFMNSQAGNNNAYCQDNPVGWIDWKDAKKNQNMSKFVQEVIAFRKAHPILRMPAELKGTDYAAKGLPDISFHGENAWDCKFEEENRLFGVMYCGKYAEKPDGTADENIYIGYNFHWGNRKLALPVLPENRKWKKIADTSENFSNRFFRESGENFERTVEIEPRTIIVLIGN